jgi:hypothetical protein
MKLHDFSPLDRWSIYNGRFEDLWDDGMDCIEAAPVVNLNDDLNPQFGTYCERVDGRSDIAHFWSLYGHLPEGGCLCIGDYPTRESCVADGIAWATEKGVPFEDFT